MMNDLYIGPTRLTVDIENRAGVRAGAGPLVTVLSLDYGYRLSESGDFNAVLALSDPRAALVLPKSAVLAFYVDERFLFRGIVENTAKSVDAGGVLRLSIKGRDMTGELAEAPVGNLDMTNGAGAGITNGPYMILSFANAFNGGAAWSLDSTNGFATTIASLYGQYSGESALTALIMAAQKTGEHFRVATDGSRQIVWLRTSTPNHDLRAIPTAGEPVAAEGHPNICYIQGFSEEIDAYRMITRIFPWGAGDGDMRLTLKASTRVPPSGFTLDANNNWLESTNAVTAIGKRIGIHVRFQDIRPVSNTSADMTAAANQLYDAALAYLQRHDFASDLRTYKLKVIQLPENVHVGDVITVEYQDQGFVIEGAQMVILAIRNRIDSSGKRTSDLTVSGVARWQEDVSREIVTDMEQGKLFTAHPQRGPNSYVTNYQRYIWNDGVNSEVASVRFRFGPEVCQLNQAAFDFGTTDGTRMLPLESTVRSVGGATSGSGVITTTVPSNNSSGHPSNNTSGSPLPANSAGPSTDVSGAPSNDNTSQASGGDTTTAGKHQHAIHVVPGAGNLGSVTLHNFGGGIYGLSAGLAPSTVDIITMESGSHTHSLSAHTHTLGGHTHTLGGHTHDLNNHTHNLNNHVHDLSEAIAPKYGVFREATSNTFNLADLQYQVNGSGWFNLATDAVSLGSNWYRLDMTALLYDSNFVPWRPDNLLEFRRNPSGSFSTRVSCMIDGQLLVRTIIQSIALT